VSDSQTLRSRRVLARLRRAKDLVYGVENALRAFSTPYTKTGERRRREQAIVMGIRQSLSSTLYIFAREEGMEASLR